MSYTETVPTFEAIQWTGDNVEDCQTFFETWWPQDAPPPPWQTWTPPPPFQYDPDSNTLNVKGYVLNVGDWMVNGGSWGDPNVWVRSPEVVMDSTFQLRYSLNT